MNSRYKTCFLSYGQPDLKVAKSINEFLRNQGIKTWAWYEQKKIGEWRPRIQKALDEHECIILVVSKRTLERAGVQDENRLALADDVRNYTGRILPVLLDNTRDIENNVKDPEQRELFNIIKRVLCVEVETKQNGRRDLKKAKEQIKDLIRKEMSKVLVIGSISVEDKENNERKRLMVRSVAGAIGKHLALHPEEPICMTTRGGGIDSFVCKGFVESAIKEVSEGRLWLYPVAQERTWYHGYGRDIAMSLLPKYEGKKKIKVDDSRGRVLVAKMAADADSIIAIRGGRGIEYAFIMTLAESKRFVCIPFFGGMSKKIFNIYGSLPNIVCPVECNKTIRSWKVDYEEVDKYAESVVRCAIYGD